MIITRQQAGNMNKQTLADLASDYATEFAHLLGHEGDVRIGPEELVYEREEALNLFLKKFQTQTYSKPIKNFLRAMEDNTKYKIVHGAAFVQDGVAFIPLLDLSEDERKLVKRLQPKKQEISSLYSKALTTFFGRNAGYVSFYGFGSEIAHLTGNKIYPGRVHNGLGEALDLASQIVEFSKDVTFLYERTNQRDNPKEIIKEKLEQDISEGRKEIVLYETLLFEGEKATKQKMIELGMFKARDVNLALRLLKKQYIMTSHYDGRKLFLEIFDSVNGDLNQTYKKLGNILSNPNVTDMGNALGELGYTPEVLSKYQRIFEKGMFERAKRLLP